MSIRFHCPSCGKAYSVKDAYAGKKAKCGCGVRISIPEAEAGISLPQVSSATSVAEGPMLDSQMGSDTAAPPRESSVTALQPRDKPTRDSPVLSVEAKCIGFLRKVAWNVDFYDDCAIFTDPEDSAEYEFPAEMGRASFATAALSGYNVECKVGGKARRFLFDKNAYAKIKALNSEWLRSKKAARAEWVKAALESDAPDAAGYRKLVLWARIWACVQFACIPIIFSLATISDIPGVHRAVIAVALLAMIPLLIAVWMLNRWAILCEAILFSVSSLVNFIVWQSGKEFTQFCFFMASMFLAGVFWRLFYYGGSVNPE